MLFYLLIILRQELLIDIYLIAVKILFTLYAISFVGEVVALISQYPRSLRVWVFLYGELLYTCREIMSKFEFFTYFMDEIVTQNSL